MRSAQTKPSDALVLLVDDNPDGILARQAVLQELGYRVISAVSGPEALKRIESEHCHLVITDYKMQPMDGLELIRELRKHGFNSPIILLSEQSHHQRAPQQYLEHERREHEYCRF